ncbi:MAG TPA: S-adenosylmethionine:tRNA ribosyltransferase-isomerase [Acidimicrobiales bacterium]|nr:S-adenosylmethionine:tRNA ribosyltransferase-isomerase [Acidimicrobiales bacterium]
MDLDDFDYHLPDQAIAQFPAEPRDAARLLVDRGTAGVAHRHVTDLPDLVRPGDLLVVNTSRVLPARLRLTKPTGGEVEVLLLERLPSGAWEALVRPSRKVKPGTVLAAGADLAVHVGGDGPGDGTRLVDLRVSADPGISRDVGSADLDRSAGDAEGRRPHDATDATDDGTAELAALARYGVVPLPPYITEPLADPDRYQTVFADRPGSVAAPTAGLHLTPDVLDRCRAAGARVASVDLVVGMGTFRPMTAAKVEDHHMHAERYHVPAETSAACEATRAAGGRVIAVGTTTVRALESAALSGRPEGRTELFIHRPWRWRTVDVLMTNFHLPRSSLLVLVDAFVGPRWRDLYAEALGAGYRFLSFGDAMLLSRTEPGPPGGSGSANARSETS